MAGSSNISRSTLKMYNEAFEALDKGWGRSCSKKKTIEEWIFRLDSSYSTDDGPAFLAITQFSRTEYAIYAPEYLDEKQMGIFEFFLREAEKGDHIIVFSDRDYEAVQKYSYGKVLDVQKW